LIFVFLLFVYLLFFQENPLFSSSGRRNKPQSRKTVDQIFFFRGNIFPAIDTTTISVRTDNPLLFHALLKFGRDRYRSLASGIAFTLITFRPMWAVNCAGIDSERTLIGKPIEKMSQYATNMPKQ
jgi:hypothetical protein